MHERDVENVLEQLLTDKGWVTAVGSKQRNVYRQQPKTEVEKGKLRGKRPDFVLYGKNERPIAIIETKKSSQKSLSGALEQAIGYANSLGVSIVFIFSKNVFFSYHIKKKASLYIDDQEVLEFPDRETLELFESANDNKIIVSEKIKISSRNDLISVFDFANKQLRKAGVTIGMSRFTEFANLLFLKLVSEKSDNLDYNIPPHISWNAYKNETGEKLLEYINGMVIPKLDAVFKNKDGDTIFDTLKITDSVALKNIIDKLDCLDIANIKTDIKGDAFEYFIQKYNSGNKDLGEYFTPRHIVNFLVKIANPQYTEKIYDPFCGTGGILIAAFNYVRADLKRNHMLSEAVLEDMRKNMLYGSEKTATAKIAKMNMILTGDGHSDIKQQDTFTNPIDKEMDVVITNIPFSQEGTGSEFYDIETTNGDSQAIQHIVKSLNDKPTARAFIIVPEGVLNNGELTSLRQKLVSQGLLKGIISLPCGVFLPYTEAKTSIICLSKTATNEKIFFYNVKNDGFTLTTRRRKLDVVNDFDEFIAINPLECYSFVEDERILWVNREDILATKNITLLGFKYNKNLLDGHIWLEKIIREVNVKNSEQFPTATVSNDNYLGLFLGEEYWGENFVSVTSEENSNYKVVNTNQFAYNPSRINVGSVVINTSDSPVAVSSAYTTFEVYNSEYIPEYIYLLLKCSDVALEIKNRSFGTVRQTLSFDDLSTIQIRKKTIEEQQKIVSQYKKDYWKYCMYKKRLDSFKIEGLG